MLEFLLGTPQENAAQQTVRRLHDKERLTDREKQILREQKQLTAPLFRRRLGFGVAALAALGGSIWFAAESQQRSAVDNLPNWLKVEDAKEIGGERVKLAVQAALDWDNKFNCGREITIENLEKVMDRYEEAYRRGFQRIGIQTPIPMNR